MPNSAAILNASVLIVDDHEPGAHALQSLLTKAGYTAVSSTTNPVEVCERHRKHRYDLILLDLNMPGMDGFEVMAALKAIEPSYLSVVVITGDSAQKMRALQCGAKDFVSKPFSSIEMLTRVRNLLEVRLLYKEAERQVRYLEQYDPLTGLPNRKLFFQLLKKTLVQAQKHGWVVSLLLLDIDRFKNVNDTLGHAFGDQMLRECSQRLRNALRFNDTIARLGGDEFGVLLLSSERAQESGAVATKIREALRPPFVLDGHEVTVTASIGITQYPVDSLDAGMLVTNGDTAMYRAKDAGRDTYRFYKPQMNERAIEKLDLESALRKAVVRQEFVLHYQPKMALDSGLICGVEALLRWNHPSRGIIAPLEFIPILEETGLIVPVGAWVIQAVCRQIAEWRHSGLGNIRTAINLSSRQFSGEFDAEPNGLSAQDDVDQQLIELEMEASRALKANSIDPALLEFEITETLLMSHAKESVAILKRLKSLGIRISIDDFGTGFSSLAYLKRFPIDAIKIDRAFVRDLPLNADDAAITRAIIGMAHTLHLKVIAEGVETGEQLDFLRAHRCDEAQGYFISKPLPAAEIAELLGSSDGATAAA